MPKKIKDIKKRIIKSLYSYPKNKDIVGVIKGYLQFHSEMNLFVQQYLRFSREVFVKVSLVDSIESALGELPPEINVYADTKYFKPNRYTLDGLAMELNVTRRTIQRWDELLIRTIERYYDSIDT